MKNKVSNTCYVLKKIIAAQLLKTEVISLKKVFVFSHVSFAFKMILKFSCIQTC